MEELLRNLQAQQQGRAASRGSSATRPAPSKQQRSYSDIGLDDGPVIDAEWTTLDSHDR